MMNRKQLYDEVSKKFYKAGLMKKIYESDKWVICNIVDACYGVIPITGDTDSPLEIMFVMGREVAEIIKDNNFAQYIYSFRTEGKKHIYVLNDAFIDVIEQMRDKVEKNGPYVDLELEKELIKMSEQASTSVDVNKKIRIIIGVFMGLCFLSVIIAMICSVIGCI